MTMNRQSYREHIINVHPNKNPLDLKVYGEKTFAETIALLRGATGKQQYKAVHAIEGC